MFNSILILKVLFITALITNYKKKKQFDAVEWMYSETKFHIVWFLYPPFGRIKRLSLL